MDRADRLRKQTEFSDQTIVSDSECQIPGSFNIKPHTPHTASAMHTSPRAPPLRAAAGRPRRARTLHLTLPVQTSAPGCVGGSPPRRPQEN
jgi:hypothetical protein